MHSARSEDSCIGGTDQPTEITALPGNTCRTSRFPMLAVGKSALFQQTAPDTTKELQASFFATVTASGANANSTTPEVVYAYVRPENCDFGNPWLKTANLNISKSSRTEIDRIAQAGNYYLMMYQWGPLFSSSRSLMIYNFPVDPWPSPPLLVNFNESKSIDSKRAFVLQLNTDPRAKTRIFIYSNDNGPWVMPVALDCNSPSANSWTLPANTLPPGRSFILSLVSSRDFGTQDDGFRPGLSLGSLATTQVAIKTLAPAIPPVIGTQPRSQTKKAGETVSFAVKASGTAPFTYQWYKNHKRISGANKPTHVIQKLKLSDAANYSVIVKNSVGNIESNEAKLTVKK